MKKSSSLIKKLIIQKFRYKTRYLFILRVFILLGISNTLLAQSDLNKGLVAYFPFNGNPNDQITGKVGTCYNTVLTTDRFDNPKSAYKFNGSSSIIHFGINSGINSLYYDFTISYWIQIFGYRNGCVIASYSAQDESCWRIKSSIINHYASTEFCCGYCGAPWQTANSSNLIYLNKWYNIIAIRSGSYVKTYINGQLAGTTSLSSKIIVNATSPKADTRIGCDWPSDYEDYFYGKIDDMRFYNRAVSTEEVELLYKEGTNISPIANAGEDQTVNEGDIVMLDGSNSYDLNLDQLTFLWTAPEGITLTSDTLSTPSFVAPEVTKDTTIVFSLTVNDGEANSTSDQVSITIKQVNKAPIAEAGKSQTVYEGKTVTLNGANSYDSDGDNISYYWTSLNDDIQLSSHTLQKPTFLAPEVDESTTYIFKLVVNDGIANSVEDITYVTVIDSNVLIPNDITLANSIVYYGTIACYNALNSITVSCCNTDVIFKKGSVTTLISSGNISFLPGFYAESGSIMNAYITTDGSFCQISQVSDSDEYAQKSIALDYSGTDNNDYDESNFMVKIYPNPNNGSFIVESNMPGTNILTITSITGQNIFLPQKFLQYINVELNNYYSGIYICKVQNRDTILIQKINIK